MRPQLPTSGNVVETDAETEALPYCAWMEERLRRKKSIQLTDLEKKSLPCRPIWIGRGAYECQTPTCKRLITEPYTTKGKKV